MPRPGKSNSKVLPVTSSIEARHVVGPVTDDTMAAILEFRPSMEELEVAVSYLHGEGSAVDRTGHPLAGKVAQLYDILSADALYANDER
jgi:hypothetical protein